MGKFAQCTALRSRLSDKVAYHASHPDPRKPRRAVGCYLGRKKSETLTPSAFASLAIVATDGLRFPRRICDRWPFEKSVSK